MILIRSIECYTPQYAGKRDLLIAGEKLCAVEMARSVPDFPLIERTILGDGLQCFPGLIDQHCHILGGGGEQSFASRLPELGLEEILAAGVTTVVGLLGADGTARSLESLYAKAKALEEEGVTAYLYSGSYALPVVTLTGNLTRDLVLIDKVIGAGEIALSDARSSQPEPAELLRLASQVYLGGLLGGKAGVVHLHIGDGKGGLSTLRRVREDSDLPAEMYIPTHVNRNPTLFREAMEYRKIGGKIDLTAGEKAGIPVPEALKLLYKEKIDLSGVTVSSDANGSVPGGGSTKIQALYDDLINSITGFGLPPELVFGLVTENAAKNLKLYPRKGAIKAGSDADLLITGSDYGIRMVFARGKVLYETSE